MLDWGQTTYIQLGFILRGQLISITTDKLLHDIHALPKFVTFFHLINQEWRMPTPLFMNIGSVWIATYSPRERIVHHLKNFRNSQYEYLIKGRPFLHPVRLGHFWVWRCILKATLPLIPCVQSPKKHHSHQQSRELPNSSPHYSPTEAKHFARRRGEAIPGRRQMFFFLHYIVVDF